MLKIRKSQDRGHAHHGWLEAKHSFSFADYYDPTHMGYSVLRVINEDKIDGGAGFPPHNHQDMEIITYIVEGALEHKDSMGNTAVMRPGEVQKMSAGTGVAHSEFNSLRDQKTHLLQIWLHPDKKGYAPSYEQKSFASELDKSKLVLVASPDGAQNSIVIHQDVKLFVGKPKTELGVVHKTQPERKTWIQIVKGDLVVNGNAVTSGDGVALSEVDEVTIKASPHSEFLLFDLP